MCVKYNIFFFFKFLISLKFGMARFSIKLYRSSPAQSPVGRALVKNVGPIFFYIFKTPA